MYPFPHIVSWKQQLILVAFPNGTKSLKYLRWASGHGYSDLLRTSVLGPQISLVRPKEIVSYKFVSSKDVRKKSDVTNSYVTETPEQVEKVLHLDLSRSYYRYSMAMLQIWKTLFFLPLFLGT